MFNHWLLRRYWLCILDRGLLDEEDIELLCELFEESNENGCEKAFLVGSVTFLVALLSISCAFSPTFALFSAFLEFACTFGILQIFPRFLCWLWSERVDACFRHFVIALRQRECALFGLHLSGLGPSRRLALPLRPARVQCLRQLCQFVQIFNRSSLSLISSNEESARLLFNFVGEEMQTLCPFPSDGDEGQINRKIEDEEENDLQITTLKSVWQYHFLVRSEFIRIALFALHRDFALKSPLDFCRHFLLILQTIWATGWLNVNFSRTAKPKTKKVTPAKMSTSQLSRIAKCRAQLEWALERLNSLDDNLNDEHSEKCRVVVAKCLEQVASSLRESANHLEPKQIGENKIEELREKMEAASQQEVDEVRKCDGEAEEEDFQIYEFNLTSSTDLYIGKDEDDPRTRRKSTFGEEESVSTSLGTHGAVIGELGDALERRKEICLQRELRALARARGVRVEELSTGELDRTLFGEVATSQKPKEELERPKLTKGPFGLPPTAVGLSADTILRQRMSILETEGAMEIVEIGGEEEDEQRNRRNNEF